MRSMEVAHRAFSARTPIVSRELLFSGGIIKISVPAGASYGVYNGAEEEIHYLKFPRNIKGGVINCFVHTNDLSYRGEKIIAEIVVMRKTLGDGRKYLYIDLRPVARSTFFAITHRLAIVSNKSVMWRRYDWIVFETPAPLGGAIILAPPEAKIVPISEPTRTKIVSDDPQLDRLLADGWEIGHDDIRTRMVALWKGKMGKRRTLIHHRPKKNGKGK